MSGLISGLIDEWHERQAYEREAKRRDEAINRAAVLLGYTGANPSDAEIQSRLHGGGPSPAEMTPEQMNAQNRRYAELAQAEDINKSLVEAYRQQAAIDSAAQYGAPKSSDFYDTALKAKLPSILNRLTTRQQADVLNNKALGDPYTLAGGVTANTETGQIADTTGAVDAMAVYRRAQAQSEVNRQVLLNAQAMKAQADAGFSVARTGTEANRQHLMDAQAGQADSTAYLNSTKRQDLFDKIEAFQQYFKTRDPRYYERATGRAAPGTGDTIKGMVDGKPMMFRVGVGPEGKIQYTLVETAEGQAIEPEAAKGRGPSTLERNNEFIQRTTGASPQEALQIQMDKYSADSKVKRILERGKTAPKSNPQADAVYGEARKALRSGVNRDALKQRLQSMGLDPSQVGL